MSKYLHRHAFLLLTISLVINIVPMIVYVIRGDFWNATVHIPWTLFAAGMLYYSNNFPFRNEAEEVPIEPYPEETKRLLFDLQIDQSLDVRNARFMTGKKYPKIVLNPRKEETSGNPLCPVCHEHIIPQTVGSERRFVCGCDVVREFTFDENFEVIKEGY